MRTIIFKDKVDNSLINNVLDNEELTIVIVNSGVNEFQSSLDISLVNNSTLHIYNVITSKNNSNISLNVHLNSSHTSCDVLNVFLTTGKSILESNVHIYHNVHDTNSLFTNYVITKGNASAILNNNAYIVKGASKSVCHQIAKGLTLSKESMIKAMPNLFIDEYDVIASHSASIGSINKEDLFYLMSRGLTLDESSKLIVMGFIKPLIDRLEDESLKKEIENSFISKL